MSHKRGLAMFNRVKNALAIPAKMLSAAGRVSASAGSALFGATSFLQYYYHDESKNLYTHPASIVTVSVNIAMNLLTRIPAIFRKDPDDELDSESEQDNTLANVLDYEDVERALNANINSSDEDTGNNREVSYSVLLRILASLTNGISSFGVLFGSYNSGKYLCEFIAAELNGSTEDEDWKYYVIHTMALYLAVSNIHSFLTYSGRSVKENIENYIQLSSEDRFSKINKKVATTAALIASLNLVTSTAFNYMSCKKSLLGINQDIIDFPAANIPDSVQMPDWLITTISSIVTVSGLFTESISVVPALYTMLESIPCMHQEAEQDDASENADGVAVSDNTRRTRSVPHWQFAMKAATYPIGFLDALINGVQGYTGVVLTIHDIAPDKVSPYGYIINFGLLCAISKTACQFSFYSKKGIDNFIEDIQKHLDSKKIVVADNVIDSLNIQQAGLEEDHLVGSSNQTYSTINVGP